MNIGEIVHFLETLAPPSLQEGYDNAGLLTGQAHWACSGIICTLDATEAVIDEAIEKKCNLVVAHHPIIFSGLKKINGKNYVERTIIRAIKNDIAIYAIHTNLDNMLTGVNGHIARKLGLQHCQILLPKSKQLKKLYFYVPPDHAEKVVAALFARGAGTIGNYSECSFSVSGTGTFTPGAAASPFTGEKGERHHAEEKKIEILFPFYLQTQVLEALKAAHPYEEVAYEIISLDNEHQQVGAGVSGMLPGPVDETIFLQTLKETFGLACVRHTALRGQPIQKVSVCGGAGSFGIKHAINSKSDIYITSDIKYHEFFDADGQILVADIGHYESEQFTIDLLYTQLAEKFPNFAVLKTTVNTNPVHYL